MRIREAGGIANVRRGIGAARKLDGHAERAFALGDSLHAIYDFIAALGHFAAELFDEIRGVLIFETLEFRASVRRYAPGDERDGGNDGERKDEREF